MGLNLVFGLRLISVVVISLLMSANAAKATPFGIKGFELGKPPQAYKMLNNEEDCRVESLGTAFECYERIGGRKSHTLNMPTTIAGESCRVASIYFANTSTPPDTRWLSSNLIFICDGAQQTYDNIRGALSSKFGTHDKSMQNLSESEMPWLYWFSGDYELTLWAHQIRGHTYEVWVTIKNIALEEERKAFESYLRKQDI